MKGKRNRITEEEAKYYEELGEKWAGRDFADYWESSRPVKAEIDIKSQVTYYPVESKLSERLDSAAKESGVSPEVLLNRWLEEKLQDKSVNK
jgi:hypothetical protein